ncbi:class I SAM-dependent methyltransferase [Brucella sp. TWI432]
MTEERMHLDSESYDPFYASQHLGRYEVLRSLCKGKVVLDIACGEGYGSSLLSKWGAKEVIGVDVSDEAIDTANKLFANETVEFHKYDAHHIDKLLQQKKVDVVACFETIEHLRNPAKFLNSIKKLLSKRSIVAISCPNEKNDFSSDNPFHLGTYSFAEFKSLTESVLGEAHGWLLGTPAQGIITIPKDDEFSLRKDARLLDVLDASEVQSTSIIPPAPHVAPSLTDCFYFVGLWGTEPEKTAVLSPLSYPAFISPWKKIEFLEHSLALKIEETENLNKRLNEIRSEVSIYRTKINKLARDLDAEKLHSGKSGTRQTGMKTIQELVEEVEMYRRSKFVRLGRKINKLYGVPVIGHALRVARKLTRILIR